jgi:hypothetical protein
MSSSSARAEAVAAPRPVEGEPPVGLDSFDVPPAAALAKNDTGVALLSKGKLEDARRELTAAVALDPSFVLARYNLACAEARLGDFAAAYKDLEAVYAVDFVGLRAHAEVDADLTAFWASAQGKALASRSASYEAKFQRIIDRGLRAILWRHEPFAKAEQGNYRSHFRPTLLRIGVFDLETQRFVAVAPRATKPALGFAGSLVPYAVLVTGEVRLMLGGDMDPGQSLDAIYTYGFNATGKPTSQVKLGGVEAYGGDLDLGQTGYVAQFWQSTVPKNPGLTVKVVFGAEPVKTVHDQPRPPTKDLASYPVRIDAGYNHWGHVVEQNTAGYVYKNLTLTLPSGRSVAIPKDVAYYRAAPNVVASPDGKQLLLVWRAATLTCDATRNVPGRHKMARVFPETGQVIPLGEGEGAGFGAFGPDAALYIQRDRRVYKVSDDSKAQTPLPEGVLFVPPLQDNPLCGF